MTEATISLPLYVKSLDGVWCSLYLEYRKDYNINDFVWKATYVGDNKLLMIKTGKILNDLVTSVFEEIHKNHYDFLYENPIK